MHIFAKPRNRIPATTSDASSTWRSRCHQVDHPHRTADRRCSTVRAAVPPRQTSRGVYPPRARWKDGVCPVHPDVGICVGPATMNLATDQTHWVQSAKCGLQVLHREEEPILVRLPDQRGKVAESFRRADSECSQGERSSLKSSRKLYCEKNSTARRPSSYLGRATFSAPETLGRLRRIQSCSVSLPS